MARRVLVAHVGRRAYALVSSAQYLLLQQVRDTSTQHDCTASDLHDVSSAETRFQNSKDIHRKPLGHDSFLDKVGEQLRPFDLPFLQCQGMSKCLTDLRRRDSSGGPAMKHSKRDTNNRDKCDNALSSKDACYPQNGSSEVGGCTSSKISAGAGAQATLNPFGKSSDAVCLGEGEVLAAAEGSLPQKQQLPDQEDSIDRCAECGGKGQAPCQRLFQLDEAGLVCTREQFLALHCAESLSADLHSSSVYPICNRVSTSAVNVSGTRTCASQVGRSCESQQVGSLGLGVLRLATSFLAPHVAGWFAHNEATERNSQTLDNILATADHFLQKRGMLLQMQTLLFQANAARKQTLQDCKALAVHHSYKHVGCLLEHMFAERVAERAANLKRAAEPFTALLDEINVLIEFCCSQTCPEPLSALLCTAPSGSTERENEVFLQEKTTIEAIQIALSFLFLLYHDVAHAIGLIQILK